MLLQRTLRRRCWHNQRPTGKRTHRFSKTKLGPNAQRHRHPIDRSPFSDFWCFKQHGFLSVLLSWQLRCLIYTHGNLPDFCCRTAEAEITILLMHRPICAAFICVHQRQSAVPFFAVSVFAVPSPLPPPCSADPAQTESAPAPPPPASPSA